MGFVDDLLIGIPVNPVLRERLLLVEKKLELVQNENKELKEKTARLEAQITKCQEQLLAYASREEFVEHLGALFKRAPNGDYVKVPYCPRCRTSTFAMDTSSQFVCASCCWVASFTGRELLSVMADLV